MAKTKTATHIKDPRRPTHTLCGKEVCEVALGRALPTAFALDRKAPPPPGQSRLCKQCDSIRNSPSFRDWLVMEGKASG